MLTQAVMRGVARGLHMAGCFSLFGTCFLAAVLLPVGSLRRRLRGVAWGSFAVLLVAGVIWFALQTADMAGAEDVADMLSAAPVVAGATRFGELLIARSAAAGVAILLFQFGFAKPAALAAGAAVVAEAWLGHGGAMVGVVGDTLLVSSVIHLTSGGAWLGSLPALWVAVKHLPIAEAARVARRFSPVGMVCVAGLTVSAVVQFVFLIGRPAALFESGYGLVTAGKILLLVALVGLAAANRYRFTPGLAEADERARRNILRSVGAEIALGVLVLLAAGLLLQLMPPAMKTMP